MIVFVLGYMLTDTEHDGRETVLLSLLSPAVVLVIALVRQKMGSRTAGAARDPETERAEVGV